MTSWYYDMYSLFLRRRACLPVHRIKLGSLIRSILKQNSINAKKQSIYISFLGLSCVRYPSYKFSRIMD